MSPTRATRTHMMLLLCHYHNNHSIVWIPLITDKSYQGNQNTYDVIIVSLDNNHRIVWITMLYQQIRYIELYGEAAAAAAG